MRRLSDTFSNGQREIEVNCYNDMGGSMSFFSLGDFVPTNKINNDFDTIAEFGRHYNILAIKINKLSIEAYVIIIRSEIFVEIKPLSKLEEIDVNGYECINTNGDPLDIKTVQEYNNAYNEAVEVATKKNKLLVALKEALDEEDQLRKDYMEQHATYKEEGLISKVVNKIKSIFR